MKTGELLSLDSLPIPKKEGFRFDGWIHCNGLLKDNFVMPAWDIELTAQWSDMDNAYVQFDLNGGVSEEITQIMATVGTVIDLANVPTPTKAGYHFEGWESKGTIVSNHFTLPTEGTVLKAKWKAREQKFSFDSRNGSKK